MTRMHLFEKEKVILCPAVASLAAPTRAEINAGIVLCNPGVYQDEGVIEAPNFTQATEFIETPDAAIGFVPKIPGRKNSGDPSIKMYESNTAHPMRNALAEGTQAVYLRMPYGDVPSKRCESFPIQVGSIQTSDLNSGADAATFTAMVAITGLPNQNGVIPAL